MLRTDKFLPCSIYSLQGLLKEEYWGNKVLLLPDVTFQDCTGFLELVYTGKVKKKKTKVNPDLTLPYLQGEHA